MDSEVPVPERELLSCRIGQTLDQILEGSADDVTEAGVALAELIARRDEVAAAELQRFEAATDAFREASVEIAGTDDLDQINELVCTATTIITGVDAVALAGLDGRTVTPLRFSSESSMADRSAVGASALRALTKDSEDMPPVVYCAGHTLFRVDVDGAPSAVVVVKAVIGSDIAEIVRALADSAGSAIALAGLRHRQQRQQALWSSVPTQRERRRLTDISVQESADVRSAPLSLTDREKEIFDRLLTGSSNTVIAADLVISIETVRTHVKSVLHKCGVDNRTQLIARYTRDTPRSLQTFPTGLTPEG